MADRLDFGFGMTPLNWTVFLGDCDDADDAEGAGYCLTGRKFAQRARFLCELPREARASRGSQKKTPGSLREPAWMQSRIRQFPQNQRHRCSPKDCLLDFDA